MIKKNIKEKKKSFRRSVDKTTACELIRMVNDLCQSDSDSDVKIRELLSDIMMYTKKMNAKLIEYKRDYNKDWWTRLPEGEKERLNKIRQDAGYKCLE